MEQQAQPEVGASPSVDQLFSRFCRYCSYSRIGFRDAQHGLRLQPDLAAPIHAKGDGPERAVSNRVERRRWPNVRPSQKTLGWATPAEANAKELVNIKSTVALQT